MDNFRNAFQQKNLVEYNKLLADTSVHKKNFTFTPSPSALARYSAVFFSWNSAQEYNYFKNAIVASGNNPFQVSFIPTPLFRYPSDSAEYSVDYSFFIPHNRTNVTQQFFGRSELFMSPDKNGIWRIYRWVDYETKKDSSWSELKGYFAK